MKQKSIIGLVILLIIVFIPIISGYINRNNSEDNNLNEMMQITIIIYDKTNEEIYNNKIMTNEKYLSDALKTVKNIELKTEKSDYGEYITSILGIEQGENYYWSYYIDNEYANTGISNCEIKDGTEYSFKIEKFEN